MKKKISYILFFSLIFLTFYCKVYGRNTIPELRAMYPHGTTYNETYSYTITKIDENGTIRLYTHNDKECAGFASTMYRKYFGADCEWGTKITDSSGIPNIGPGDIVRNDGHSVFVISRSGDTVKVAEANYGSYNNINWDRSININSFYTNFAYIYKAYFTFDNPSTAPAVETAQNITASYNTSTGKLKVSWSRAKKASGYNIRVCKKSDVNNNNYSSPVLEYYSDTNTATTANIDFNQNGTFYVFVVTYIDEYNAVSGGTPAEFSREEVQRVSIGNKPSGNIYVNDSFRLSSTTLPSNASIGSKVTWSSSNESIATVGASTGTVSALKEGTVTITATTANNKKDSYQFTIKKYIDINSVTLNTSNLELQKGGTYKLKATITPTNASEQAITWTSSNTNVATIDSSGTVRGVTPGQAVITAKTSNNKTAVCNVNVYTSGVRASFTQDTIVARFSSIDLLNYVKTSDNSSIDQSKIKFKVLSGKANTYSLSGSTLSFSNSTTSYDNELYNVEVEYYGNKDTVTIRKTADTYLRNKFQL